MKRHLQCSDSCTIQIHNFDCDCIKKMKSFKCLLVFTYIYESNQYNMYVETNDDVCMRMAFYIF